MKLAAIIVIYKPDTTSLYKNILSVIKDVDHLLLYKNSDITEGDSIFKNPKITFLGSGENVGISSALNQAVFWARSNNYTHLLTLDQDSLFREGDLPLFKSIIGRELQENIGIFCPNISNRGSLLIDFSQHPVVVVDSITSGSIFPLEIFEKCGNFDEGLFIDAVDYEYCYRIFKHYNLKTIIYPNIILNHEVGYPTKIKFGLTTDNYSAFRTYYIIRNHIIIWKRYPQLFQSKYKKTLIKIHIILRFVKVIIGEDDKISKLKSISLGVLHGLRNK